MNDVTLHISVAPVDWRQAEHILPHQLMQWGAQVTDVQFTLDLHRSKGRYGVAGTEPLARLRDILDRLCQQYPHAHVEEVDYSPAAAAAVADRFFGGQHVPKKNHYGGPYYAYFYGWHTARHDVVLHLDSDMLFGGGSQGWVREGMELLASRPDVVMCSPHPGPPPRRTGLLPHQLAAHGPSATQEQADPPSYRMAGCSTRLFMLDRRSFISRLGPLPVERPRLKSHLRARVEGHVPVELPELTISRRMRTKGQWRVDFLGEEPGMWSLHPALRSEEFYDALPTLVSRIESGDIPDAQRGDFDVNDSLVDWTNARIAARQQVWHRRMRRQARSAAQAHLGRRDAAAD